MSKKAKQILSKVKMVFKEHKYYRDPNKPIFYAGKTYELEGSDWIQRWLKRGGKIVEGDLNFPEVKPDPSVIVKPEDKKIETKLEEKVEEKIEEKAEEPAPEEEEEPAPTKVFKPNRKYGNK